MNCVIVAAKYVDFKLRAGNKVCCSRFQFAVASVCWLLLLTCFYCHDSTKANVYTDSSLHHALETCIKLEFHGRVFLVASSWHRSEDPFEDVMRMLCGKRSSGIFKLYIVTVVIVQRSSPDCLVYIVVFQVNGPISVPMQVANAIQYAIPLLIHWFTMKLAINITLQLKLLPCWRKSHMCTASIYPTSDKMICLFFWYCSRCGGCCVRNLQKKN